jgi:outer membrane lipoprotein-sorting protein
MRETRLLNYAAGLPRLFEVYDDDKLIRRSEVTQVAINQNLPETLFDLREPRAPRS